MARAQFVNNAHTTLAANITGAATTLTVATGKGTLFPVVASYFYCTLSEDSLTEIVKVTARSGDVFTVVRAQEGTTAQAFSVAAKVSLNLTAAALAEFAVTADLPAPYTHPDKHAASVITQDENNRFVSDIEKASWNGKATVASPEFVNAGDSPAVKITNTGLGASFLIEDSTSPDATPFGINADGQVFMGTTAPSGLGAIYIAAEDSISKPNGNMTIRRSSASSGAAIALQRTRGTVLEPTAVLLDDQLGGFLFGGMDATGSMRTPVLINAVVDTEPSGTLVPSALVVKSTTRESTLSVERLRIASDGKTTVSGYAAISNDTNNAALTITNTGTGNSLVIEDSTSPDSTPVVVTNEGKLVIGGTIPLAGNLGQVEPVQIIGTGGSGNASLGIYATTTAGGPSFRCYAQSNTVGSSVGGLGFYGYDGINYKGAASIFCNLDVDTVTGKVQGALVFRNTNSAGSTIERLRIASDGKSTFTGYTSIVNSSNNAALTINNTGTGNSLVIEDSTSPDSTPVVVTADGQLVIGATTGVPGNIGQIEALQVTGTGNYLSALGLYAESLSTTANMRQYRKRPANAALIDGDGLGCNAWFGWDGTSYKQSVFLGTNVQGAVAPNSVPSRLYFRTTPVGGTTPIDRLAINNDGRVTVYSGLLGPNDTQQHTLPAVTADTFALLNAPQTLTNKTLDTPALTGIPVAPTATAGTNTTQVATTAFVMEALGDVAAALDLINGV